MRDDFRFGWVPYLAVAALSACSAGSGATKPHGGGPGTGGSGPYGSAGSAGAGGDTSSTGGSTDVSAGGTPDVGGTSGAAGTATSSGGTPITPITEGTDAGPFAGYDPTVKFDFPETVPTAGSCEAGQYAGTFSGFYSADVIFGFPVPIAGNVNLTLEQSQDGEFFKLANGKISGLVYGFIPFSSDLTGTLDCKKAMLVNGFMPNGKYTIGTTDYPYEGPLDAPYDKLTHAFVNGKWQVGEPTFHKGDPPPQFGGSGDWSANYTGP